MDTSPPARRGVLGALGIGSLAASLPARAANAAPRSPSATATPSVTGTTSGTGDPLPGLARATRPLMDLGALERMVGDAKVVGVGEATHGSAEFFRTKHRLFRRLAAHRGVTTYALEVHWSAGLRVNDYVRYGAGDIERIVREEFQGPYVFWHTREHLDLIRWMRSHNLRNPDRRVQFVGTDLAHSGPELYDTVTGYVARVHPDLLTEVRARYRASRPTLGTAATIKAHAARPLAVRRAMAADTRHVLELLERRRTDPWVVQHARVIAQTGADLAFDLTDPAQATAARVARDRAMADNTAWWQRRTGQRILLSAHNGHIGYESGAPELYPVTQGARLREEFGSDYRTVGFTFGRGSFHAFDLRNPTAPMRAVTLGAPAPGGNEETLERVARHDYCLDLRALRGPARKWAGQYRDCRSIGGSWPAPGARVRLDASYDVLVHLHRITASERL